MVVMVMMAMESQRDDGWRRCRRRKSGASVVVGDAASHSHKTIETSPSSTTIIEFSSWVATAAASSPASPSMPRIGADTTTMSALASTMSSIVTTAVETSATARNSLNPHHQNQLKLVHHHHPSSASLSGVREHRHNHIINLKLKQRQHRAALWILNLIINCLLLGHNFCSAFQQQQQQHQSMTNNAMQQRIHHPTQNAVLGNHGITTRSLMKSMQPLFFSPTNQRESSLHQQQQQRTTMTSTTTTASTTTTINNSKNKSSTNSNLDKDSTNQSQPQRSRKQYRRKLPLSPSEKSAAIQRQKRRAAYETMRSASLATTNAPPSIWSFDSFFAAPVLDEKSIQEDLFGTKEREAEMIRERANRKKQLLERRKEWEGLLRSEDGEGDGGGVGMGEGESAGAAAAGVGGGSDVSGARAGSDALGSVESAAGQEDADYLSLTPSSKDDDEPRPTIDKVLTRMVQDRMYGLTRSPAGSIQYSSSLMDSGRAVQFRDGIRLGKALAINIDRLCYFAKKDFSHGRLEEAQEFYMKARNMDPTDGRPYLGLSRIAQRRGDYEAARSLLKEGVARSSGGFVVVKGPVGGGGRPVDKGSKNGNRRGNSRDNKNNVDFEGEDESPIGTIPDVGPNPFLLQALGTLEQQMGQLAAAEELYLQAIRSRPSHAAAWVSLAQLRTRELRQGASAGRACYQSAERELQRIGAKPNSFVYTAWASMEYKKGSREDDTKCIQKARELYRKALNVDPHCSAAYLQLGVMESECGNFDEAKMCFEKVLKFDQRNSRVLQAYAVMESRRAPKDEVDSRRVLDLFERALKANPRDAGVYQAYALYVAELGDIDSARKLLQKATEVNKRHAPAWQAWGVLETRYSTAKAARDVFQQGIWSCARPGGGQSGGRDCARLWQAWGILEAQEGDHAAARRCFSRALDADKRNAAAVTAWTLMEAELGNFADARSIFERVLKLFRSPSADKTAIWRAYEVMEERAGNTREAQLVFQRSMRETISSSTEDEELIFPVAVAEGGIDSNTSNLLAAASQNSKPPKRNKEVEVSSWSTGSDVLDAEVWLNNGSIEGKVPASMMKKLKNRRS